MARIRTIKPEFWTDEDMAEVSEAACLLAIGLLNYADDEGYFNANPKLIKAAVFPIREPSVTIPVMLRELSNHGYLTLFSSPDNKHFGLVKNFARHQVVNKPRPSKIREMQLLPYDSGSDTGGLPSGMDQGSGNGKEEHSLAGVRESMPPSENPNPDANNAILNNRLPPGGFGALGKFVMCDDWQPDHDFQQKAAIRGVILTEPVKPHELAEFIAYWKPEGKAFHHTQWETKLAQSIQFSRNKTAEVNHAQTSRRDSQRPDYKGNAVEAVHAATAELRRQYGCEDDDPGNTYLGQDGGTVFGQVDPPERSDTLITLDQRDWETH